MSDEKEESERPFDASDQHAVERRTSKAKRKEAKRLAGLKLLCDSSDGRAWIWGFLDQFGFTRSSFSPDALAMAFKEGERNVTLRVMADINRVAPDTYLRMQRENATDE